MTNNTLNKTYTLEEIIKYISRSKCLNCKKRIDLKYFHVPLCKKCRILFTEKLDITDIKRNFKTSLAGLEQLKNG
jgi:hypothetical protein